MDAASVCGVRVRVTTSQGEEVQGEIFTYDHNTQTVVLGEHARSVFVCLPSVRPAGLPVRPAIRPSLRPPVRPSVRWDAVVG